MEYAIILVVVIIVVFATYELLGGDLGTLINDIRNTPNQLALRGLVRK